MLLQEVGEATLTIREGLTCDRARYVSVLREKYAMSLFLFCYDSLEQLLQGMIVSWNRRERR
jgi:hypothetical protein